MSKKVCVQTLPPTHSTISLDQAIVMLGLKFFKFRRKREKEEKPCVYSWWPEEASGRRKGWLPDASSPHTPITGRGRPRPPSLLQQAQDRLLLFSLKWGSGCESWLVWRRFPVSGHICMLATNLHSEGRPIKMVICDSRPSNSTNNNMGLEEEEEVSSCKL